MNNQLQTNNVLQNSNEPQITTSTTTPYSQMTSQITSPQTQPIEDLKYEDLKYEDFQNHDDIQKHEDRLNRIYKGKQNRQLFKWMEANPCKIVPQNLCFENWQSQKDPSYDQTPLMIYLQDLCKLNDGEIISFLRSNPDFDFIPSEFKYENWQIDRDDYGETPLMQWLRYYPFIVPKCLLYEKWQEDVNCRGETPLMQQLESFKGQHIPKEYKYPDWQSSTNHRGETPEQIFERRFPNEQVPLDFNETSIFDTDTSDSYKSSISSYGSDSHVDNSNDESFAYEEDIYGNIYRSGSSEKNIYEKNSIQRGSAYSRSAYSCSSSGSSSSKDYSQEYSKEYSNDYSFEQFGLSREQESSSDKK